MTLRIILALCVMALVSGCSLYPYPLGHSSYGYYYGGGGGAGQGGPFNYVPKELQREQPMF